MTSVSAALQEEMERGGPIRFDRFMEVALYLPEHGYYRRARDPFGVAGDFVTASQIQPLFGRLIAAEAEALCPGQPVFELGPGRGEMASAFCGTYVGVEAGACVPHDLSGFVLANEFFDALPVRAGIRRGAELLEHLVGWRSGRFVWVDGPLLEGGDRDYVRQYWPDVPDGGEFEIGREALNWVDLIADRMRHGSVLILDYGYATAETTRFPAGTLMSYRRHQAMEDVLADPGARDITAHVAFDALCDHARRRGFRVSRRETLPKSILRIVEKSPALIQSHQERQQLKTLLAGMGENFHTILLDKSCG